MRKVFQQKEEAARTGVELREEGLGRDFAARRRALVEIRLRPVRAETVQQSARGRTALSISD